MAAKTYDESQIPYWHERAGSIRNVRFYYADQGSGTVPELNVNEKGK